MEFPIKNYNCMQTLFCKWWVILIQGILLIALSIFIFSHPAIALASLAFWLSILILISGFGSLLMWWLTSSAARQISFLLLRIGSIALGLLLLIKAGSRCNCLRPHRHLDDRNRRVADATGMASKTQWVCSLGYIYPGTVFFNNRSNGDL